MQSAYIHCYPPQCSIVHGGWENAVIVVNQFLSLGWYRGRW
jgi:hypothetical protein